MPIEKILGKYLKHLILQVQYLPHKGEPSVLVDKNYYRKESRGALRGYEGT